MSRLVNIGSFGCLLLVLITSALYSQSIAPGVRVTAGAINGVFIERNGKTLVVYGDPKNEIKKADMILFTHFRRDVIWAGRKLVQNGTPAVAPAAQKVFFSEVDSVWAKIAGAQFREHTNHTTKIGLSPLKIDRFVKGDDKLAWQDVKIKVLSTTGYTSGSVSYIADIDNKKIA